MAIKTISELNDGTATQTSAAEVAFEEGAATFRGPVRPNPVQQINVRNQAQLEAELGVNLEILAGTNVTIVVDDSFTLTTPIKVGNGSGLELVFSNVGPVVTWNGTGAMIQNIIPGVDESSFLVLENVNVSGDTNNSLVDITIISTGFSTFNGVNVDNLASIGTITGSAIAISRFTGFGLTQGFVFIELAQLTLSSVIVGNFSATNTTWFSVITNGPALVTINDVSASNSVADGDSLFFIDPNSAPTTSFIVETSGITDTLDEGIFYQLGSDIDIDSVTNNGGIAQFVTTPAHELVVGTPVVIRDFSTNMAYNGTFVVTAVPTAMTFETGVAFGSNETIGIMNKSSLDSTNPEVFARGNRSSPDSNTISESSISGTLEVDGSTMAAVPILDIVSAPGDWIQDPTTERFSVNTTTGVVTYNGTITITGMIKYSLTVEAAAGPAAQTLIIDLRINGAQQTKTIVNVITAAGGVAAAYNGGNFIINPGDTFQLFKDNTTNMSNTNVSATTLLINED